MPESQINHILIPKLQLNDILTMPDGRLLRTYADYAVLKEERQMERQEMITFIAIQSEILRRMEMRHKLDDLMLAEDKSEV